MSACEQCLVRNKAICSSLDPDEIEQLDRIGRRQKLSRGQSIMWEGDDSLLVANVIEGVLKLSTSTSDGREQIVGVVYAGDFIGRPFGQRSHHTVTALTDAKVCSFSRAAFDQFARLHPELEHKLLQRTLDELDRARNWMLLLGRKSASERVATFLLDMSRRMEGSACAQPGGGEGFELPLFRQQIGDVLGLTIETISRQMTQLRLAGIIDLPDRRTVVIRNRQAMERIAGT